MMRKSCRTALDTRLIELGTCRMTLGSRRIAVETRRMELKICPITQGSSRRALESCRVAFVTRRMEKGSAGVPKIMLPGTAFLYQYRAAPEITLW